jgi:hypothetical protein
MPETLKSKPSSRDSSLRIATPSASAVEFKIIIAIKNETHTIFMLDDQLSSGFAHYVRKLLFEQGSLQSHRAMSGTERQQEID